MMHTSNDNNEVHKDPTSVTGEHSSADKEAHAQGEEDCRGAIDGMVAVMSVSNSNKTAMGTATGGVSGNGKFNLNNV